MTDHPGWYPPGQVCHPPELPTFLRNVCDLKPIVGVPNDDEVIGIHAVMQAARKVSEVPGMHDPSLIMKLGDHLFSVQMARYRSRYSLVTFPSDATYTPPALPTHVTVSLEPISGVPSDDEIIKVQEAVQVYQDLRRFPSMYDAHINMELSQHLFDIQMARYMRLAGETPPSAAAIDFQNPAQNVEQPLNRTEEANPATNNVGTGANAMGSPSAPGIEIRELLERSNQLAERFNQLLERSNELVDQRNQPVDSPNPQPPTEQFNQVLERLIGVVERSHQPAEQPDRLAERFNQLLERFNQLIEQSHSPAQRANELAERSNELADRANQFVEKLNQSSEHSNKLAEEANKSGERIADVLGNINRVLVGVQHAIVRNHKGNTSRSADCLVNERGDTPAKNEQMWHVTFEWLFQSFGKKENCQLPVVIEGAQHILHMDNQWLARYLRFYGVGEHYLENKTSNVFKKGTEGTARVVLARYLSSCLA